MKLKKTPKVEKVKTKYPKVLDEIEFSVTIGETHADNPENNGQLRGEKLMLEKVKALLSK